MPTGGVLGIVVPTLDEASTILGCLAAIGRGPRLEVVLSLIHI